MELRRESLTPKLAFILPSMILKFSFSFAKPEPRHYLTHSSYSNGERIMIKFGSMKTYLEERKCEKKVGKEKVSSIQLTLAHVA